MTALPPLFSWLFICICVCIYTWIFTLSPIHLGVFTAPPAWLALLVPIVQYDRYWFLRIFLPRKVYLGYKTNVHHVLHMIRIYLWFFLIIMTLLCGPIIREYVFFKHYYIFCWEKLNKKHYLTGQLLSNIYTLLFLQIKYILLVPLDIFT